MKKRSSLVWHFFDRVEENKRCIGVLCKLCDTRYKFFGNTTNMRQHLTCKHPLQWELGQNGNLDESTLHYGDDTDQSTVSVPSRRKYKDKNVRYSVSVDKNDSEEGLPQIGIQRVDVIDSYEYEIEQDDTDAEHLVQQVRNGQVTDEEWLEEEAYESSPPEHKRKRKMTFKKIKREMESPPRRLPYKSNTYIPSYEQPERVIVQHKDEYAVFGEYVANKLRKVKLPKTRGNLQQLITTILWQAEYGMYDKADAVKRVLAYSVQDNTEPVEHLQHTSVDFRDSANQRTEIVEEYIETKCE